MSSVQCLRELINERLTAAAEEIFRVFQTTIVEYEKEIDRQRRLLDIVWKPEIKLHRIELTQQHVCKEEEVLADQQLCNQERNSSLDQEAPQIKEEQEELCTSLEGEQLVLKEETETFMWTPTCEESDNSEDQTEDSDETQSAAEKEHMVIMSVKSLMVPKPNSDDQLLSHNSHVLENQDHKGGKYGYSGSTGNAETKPKRHHRRKNHTNIEGNSATSKIHSNIYTGKKSLKCNTCGKAFQCKSNLNKHLRIHTELLQQHVCEEEEVLTEQQLCNQEKNSSLDQEDPEPPQIKEEQEEVYTSLEGEQLVLKQETETFMWTPTCEESDNSEDQTEDSDETESAAEKEHVVSMLVKSSVVSEPNSDDQLLSHNSHVLESQDHKGGKHGDSGSTGNAETEPKKRHHRRKNPTNNEDNSTTSKIHSNIYTGKKSLKCNTYGKAFKCMSNLNKHLRVHTELLQQHVCEEEEVLTDQQLCNQERNSSLDQEDPEPPQIKEEQEEVYTSLEGEQLVLKQETETFMWTPTCEESDSSEDQTEDSDEIQSAAEKEHIVSMLVKSSVVSEPNGDDQLLSHNSHVLESQDHKGGKHGDSGSTGNAETEPKKRHHRRKNPTNNEDNSTTSKINSNIYTGKKSLKCNTYGKAFKCKSNLNKHLRVHTELLQQHVCEEEEVLTDQQPCNQERNSRLDQEGPEPPQIKEEQEEVYTSLEGEQLVLKQETETFMWTPTCEESDNSEDQTEDSDETQSAAEKEHVVSMLVKSSVVSKPNSDDQLLSHNSHVLESQDHKGGKHGDSGSTRNAETEPKKRHHRRKNPTNNEDNSTTSKIHSNIYTGKKSLKCNTYGKAFKCKSNLNKHLRVHTELLQQNVCEEEEVLTDQQPCNQEKNSSLAQEDPEPPQIKEEQEEVYTSLEGEQLVLKQETETFMWTPTCEESDNSEDQTEDSDETESAAEKEHVVSMLVKSSVVPEPNSDDQLLSHNSHVAESQDHKGGKLGDSGSTRNAETEPKKRHHRRKNPTNNEDNSTTSKIHGNIYTGKKSLKCNTYGKAFKCKSNLNKHLRVHTGEKAYPCNTCEKRFSQPAALKVHMRVHTGEKPYTCNTCEKRFSELGTLKQHMRTHTGEKPYTCNTCEKRFCKPSALKVHMRVHTGERPYPCNTCEKRFFQHCDLKLHMRIHTGEKPYTCNTCEKRFCQLGALKLHMRVHTGKKPYTCNTCEKRFSKTSALKVHMRVHTGEKPYPCNTCERRFSDLGTLKQHMRTHTGEKPYTCNTCEKRFSKPSTLKVHMRVHTGEKPYTCNICEKRFSHLGALKRHIRVHTGEKPYSCNICEKRFSRLRAVKPHMRIHTGEKP
ncbi:zinc finger protein 845-like isoform X1 [Thunnus thynnus]|uniref:zinc finger protein 845-like isoform X1 n=1 Tax=Thunnus thynnus TaxID=8237 RepID=UPI00352874CB